MTAVLQCGHCKRCQICRLIYKYPRRWGKKFGITPEPLTESKPNAAASKLPCKFRLDVVTWCSLGNPRLDVYGCEIHDECIIGPVKGKARFKQCYDCTDRPTE